MYNDLEKKLDATGHDGAEWLSNHLGVTVRQIYNYRSGDTPAPKLVIEKMARMVDDGESMLVREFKYDPDRAMHEAGHKHSDF